MEALNDLPPGANEYVWQRADRLLVTVATDCNRLQEGGQSDSKEGWPTYILAV
jgi:hypothetical protein